MSTDLTVKDVGALVQNIYGGVEIPVENQRTPRIKLLQSNSKEVTEEGYKLGTYHCTEFGENLGDVLKFIPVKFYFGAAYLDLKEGMKCKTLDGVKSIHGDSCRECPFNEYHLNWKINGKQSKCQSTIEIIGIETSTGQPCVLSLKSKSYNAGMSMVRQLNANLRKGDRNLYTYNVGTMKQSNDKGTYFVSTLVGKPAPVEDPHLISSVAQCAEKIEVMQNSLREVDNGDVGYSDR